MRILAAALSIFAILPAQAGTWSCGAPQVSVGDPGLTPVTSVLVNRTPAGWSVVHVLANGQTVIRENQYSLGDRGYINGGLTWEGSLRRNPSLIMVGSVRPYKGRVNYVEQLTDTAHGNGTVMQSVADCGEVTVSDYRELSGVPPTVYRSEPPPNNASQPTPTSPPQGTGAIDSVPIVSDGRQARVSVILAVCSPLCLSIPARTSCR